MRAVLSRGGAQSSLRRYVTREDSGPQFGGVTCAHALCRVDYGPEDGVEPVPNVDAAFGPSPAEVRSDVTAAAEDGARDRARRLGLQAGLTVQELGYDDDVDDDLRAGIEQVIEGELVDEDFDDVVDVVIMWWREDDGDLVDALVDAIGLLADHGVVWLITPKPGRPGHVEAEDISDAAPTAGLQQTSTISAGSQWQGTRLVAPRAKR